MRVRRVMSDVARVYGPSSVAVAKEKLGSTLGATQLTLEVHCVALCDNDVRMSRGELAELCAPLPYVPGHCVSGVARQLGGAVEHLKADDRVVGLLPMMEDGAVKSCSSPVVSDARLLPEVVRRRARRCGPMRFALFASPMGWT